MSTTPVVRVVSDTATTEACGRDPLVAAITTFLARDDARLSDGVRELLEREIDAAGPEALSALATRLAGPGPDRARKEWAAGPAASNGDVRRVGASGSHVGCAVGNSSAANGFAGLISGARPCRATLNSKPMQPSIASRLDPP